METRLSQNPCLKLAPTSTRMFSNAKLSPKKIEIHARSVWMKPKKTITFCSTLASVMDHVEQYTMNVWLNGSESKSKKM